MVVLSVLLAVMLFAGGYALGAYAMQPPTQPQQENVGFSPEGLPIMSAPNREVFEAYMEGVIAKRLLESGHQLEGVPGFYMDSSGVWTFVKQWRGILIPARDVYGRIQGLQVRRDDTGKGKLRWTASANIQGSTRGCGAETWAFLAL